MATRRYDYVTGIETATAPTAADPSAASDVMTKGYADATYGPFTVNVSGTYASPILITAGGGITPVAGKAVQLMFIAGSGGPVDITVNPQIAAGTIVGQILRLIGTHATNTVTFDDGTGTSSNGSRTVGQDFMLEYQWLGSKWSETGFSER